VPALLALLGSVAAAEERTPAMRLEVGAELRPGLSRPLRLTRGGDRARPPIWASKNELWTRTPARFSGLASVGKPGTPVHDAGGWYASANGCLVELRPDGGMPVLLHGVQGIDVDVKARHAVAVSREPDHTIVLHRWGRAPIRRVLLRGDRFHSPRLSPDGQRVLIEESRAAGGHLWLVEPSGQATDLGPGSGASWHPDGRRIIYSQLAGDGYRVTSADLFLMDVSTRRAVCLGRTPTVAEVSPVISPDGERVAFVDARSGELYLAVLADGGR
jgi:hypothetical protein